MGDRGGMPSTMAGDDGIPAVSLDQIRTLIMVLATISAAAALFVTLTYSIFLEKRRSSTGLLVLASAIAATAIEIDLSLAGYMTEELASNQSFCNFQGFTLLFSGLCNIFFWLAIIWNLFRRVRLDLPETPATPLIAGALVAASILSGIGTMRIQFDGVWCFIASDEIAYLVFCYYGWLILCSILGTGMWVVITMRLVDSLRRSKLSARKDAVKGAANAAFSASNATEQRPLLTAPELQVNYAEKVALIRRQVVFITGFLVLFYVQLLNRVVIWITGEATAIGWYFHATAIALIGVWMCAVFGLTSRNFQLWAALLSLRWTEVVIQ